MYNFATKHVFHRDKSMLVVTRNCREKIMFVATKDVFCRDKRMFDTQSKTFLATKMILVAAPANDSLSRELLGSRHDLIVSCTKHLVPNRSSEKGMDGSVAD